MIQERVTLYYREGASDKVYQATIEEADGGCVVNFAYGRRGRTLKTGTKTSAPVPFAQAKKIYDRLVKSKTAKGYTPGADGTPYAGTDMEARDTGIRPQLLNPIDEGEVERYLADDDFWMQEKHDGQRVLVQKVGGVVTGINRRGLAIALPMPVHDDAGALKGDFLIDGEAMGATLVAFDCLLVGTTRIDAHPYRDRLRALNGLLPGGGPIQLVTTKLTSEAKRDYLAFLRAKRAEGVVFKNREAAYRPGRPASGGMQLKLKFVSTASCIVAPGRIGKRSVGLEVLDGKKRIPIGNVTIPGKQPIPKPGSVAEIRYLYAYPGGSLYQPVYLGVRKDILASDCTIAQLKFRRDDAEDEA